MQDSDNKPRRVGRHAAPVDSTGTKAEPNEKPLTQPLGDNPGQASVQDKSATDAGAVGTERKVKRPLFDDDIEADEYDYLSDDGDIPIRRKPPRSQNNRKKKNKHRNARGQSKRRQDKLFSEKRFEKRRSFVEIISATSDDGPFRPIHIFGHQLKFWPLIVALILLIIVGFIAISNGDIKVREQKLTVVGLPKDLENYRILLVSDMNGKRFGDCQATLIREVENAGYDMILCVGDMVGKDGDPEPFYEFLEGISRPSRVYFICGDSDPGPLVPVAREIEGTLDEIVLEDWILGAIERGAHYVDTPMSVKVGESRIWPSPTSLLNIEALSSRNMWQEQMKQEEEGVITGLVSDYNSLPFTSYRAQLAQNSYAILSSIEPTDFQIGLTHILPGDDFLLDASTHDGEDGKFLYEPELIVAGHYCGGVWQLPLIGAVYIPNSLLPRNGWFPDKEDTEGLSQIGESQVYITKGLSTTSAIPVLPFRMFNSPEIVQIKLSAKLPDNMLTA